MANWRPIQLITLKQDLTTQWSNKPVALLRMLIVIWSIIVIMLSFFIDNPYVLAGILAYEVLP